MPRIIPRALQEKASQRACERADCREGLFLRARSGCREGREPGLFRRIQGREYPRFATIEALHGGAAQVTFLASVSQQSVSRTSGTKDAIQDSSSRRISAARRIAARNEGPKARSIAGITWSRSRLRVWPLFVLVASSRNGMLRCVTNAVISPRVSPSIGRMISSPCACASGFMPARPAAPVPRRKLKRQVSI